MNRKNINEFTFLVSSDLDYEKMVVYIDFNDNQTVILSCDEGINQTKIEIMDKYEEKLVWNFDYKSFSQALEFAYNKLKEANNYE